MVKTNGFLRKGGDHIIGGKYKFTDRVLRVWGGLEGALALPYVAHGQRGPTVVPPGCHLRKGQQEEGEDGGALKFVVTLLYTH